jgi:hypothetical protein
MIFAMARARSCWLAAVTGIAIAGAGCGSSGHPARASAQSQRSLAVAADARAVGVIRAWSTALRKGDVNGAARYFALPSKFSNGAGEVAIHTEAQARAVNAALPCGALLLSADRRGRFIRALFRLTDRPGPNGGCGLGAGQLARTDFIIAGGRIIDWIRAPNPGGGGPSPGPEAPPTPSGPVV